MHLDWKKYLKWRDFGTFDNIRLRHSLANAFCDAKEGRARPFRRTKNHYMKMCYACHNVYEEKFHRCPKCGCWWCWFIFMFSEEDLANAEPKDYTFSIDVTLTSSGDAKTFSDRNIDWVE